MSALDVPTTLAWMTANGARLRELVLEEQGADGGAPADDAGIRAHLRFVALALEANGDAELSAGARGLADELPGWFAEQQELFDRHVATGEGAIALEEHLQYGTLPGNDPSLDEGLMRRVRINGWARLFLLLLEVRLGPARDGLSEQVLAWTGDRQRDLSRLILALQRGTTSAAGARSGDFALKEQIGQLAVVQGHLRQLLEALAACLSGGEP